MHHIKLRFDALNMSLTEINTGVAHWMRQYTADQYTAEAKPWTLNSKKTNQYLFFPRIPTRLRYIVGTDPLPKE